MTQMVKSNWDKFIQGGLKKGVAFLGSVWNKDQQVIQEHLNAILDIEFYVDRKYKSGSSTIRLSKLSPSGESIGYSTLDRQGNVLKYGKFWLVIKNNNIVIYADSHTE